MNTRPKRRKLKDNPYSLIRNNNTYIVKFKDAFNFEHTIEVTEKVYNCFNHFELIDLSQMNEFDRHIEHFKTYESLLYKNLLQRENDLETIVINRLEKEKLYKAINSLPKIQKRRIIQYYFKNETKKEIAQKDNCSVRAIQFSIDIAIKNLKLFLK